MADSLVDLNGQPGLICLPADPMLNVLSFLNYKDLIRYIIVLAMESCFKEMTYLIILIFARCHFY